MPEMNESDVTWLPLALTPRWTRVRTAGTAEFLIFRLNQVVGLGVGVFLAVFSILAGPPPGLSAHTPIVVGLCALWLSFMSFLIRALMAGLYVSTRGVKVIDVLGGARFKWDDVHFDLKPGRGPAGRRVEWLTVGVPNGPSQKVPFIYRPIGYESGPSTSSSSRARHLRYASLDDLVIHLRHLAESAGGK